MVGFGTFWDFTCFGVKLLTTFWFELQNMLLQMRSFITPNPADSAKQLTQLTHLKTTNKSLSKSLSKTGKKTIYILYMPRFWADIDRFASQPRKDPK